MRITSLAMIIGLFVAALGVIGLVSGEGQILEAMNIDLFLDISRIVLGGMLIWGSATSDYASRVTLGIFAVVYLAAFVVGLISPTLYGLLPNGLAWFDQTLNLIGGIATTAMAVSRQLRTVLTRA